MREPTAQQQKLHALVGTWIGEDTTYPTPFNPAGGTATTTFTGRAALDGLFVIGDDVQEQEGRVGFLAHKVYGYDPDEHTYTFHLFDSFGANPATPARGTWEGNILQFEQATPLGHARYRYTFAKNGDYIFSMHMSQDGTTYTPFIEGHYKRQ